MLHWIPYPFVRIVVFFITGIVLGIVWPNAIPQSYVIWGFGALVVLYVLLVVMNRSKVWANPGYVGLLAILLAGYGSLQVHTDIQRPDHLTHLEESVNRYRAVLIKYPEEKERSWKVEAQITEVYTEHGWKDRKGKVLLYLSKEAFPQPFRYGDVLLVKGTPGLVPSPANPGEFDYKRFLSFRNIDHQHFVAEAGDVILAGNDPPNVFLSYAIRARLWADDVLKQCVQGDREQAIASALVLGVTEGLDNDLLNAYAGTGAMHILSVSGLHVGIIYWLVLFFLKPLPKTASGKWIQAVVGILILWGYAFVTGLSPSVLRAVTMFSFVAWAQAGNQRTNIYNTLAASAFCLLIVDPYLVMSVGFQLSYLAVLGIVYLQPGLYALWEPKNRLWDEVWKVTCVSIAAQVATFPLGLFYFHQFPNYFLLSNLFVIPLSFVVLILGVAVLAFYFFQPLAVLLGSLLEWLIKIMNSIVFGVDSLPFSHLENVHLTMPQCWLLMGMIVMVILLVKRKRITYLYAAVCLTLCFSGAGWWHFQETVNVPKLTVYKVKGHTALDMTFRGQAFFLADTVLKKDVAKLKRYLQPGRTETGVRTVRYMEEQPFAETVKGGRIIVWKEHSFLQLTHKNFSVPEWIKVDYLIISNNAVTDLSRLTDHVEAKEIILDSSNTYYIVNQLLKSPQASRLKIHSVLHQGAFTKLINL